MEGEAVCVNVRDVKAANGQGQEHIAAVKVYSVALRVLKTDVHEAAVQMSVGRKSGGIQNGGPV